MIVVNVRMTIDPNQREAYLKFIDELVDKSLHDHGNLAYAHYQDTHNENQYLILEHWASQSALDAHLKTPHLIKFKEQISNYTVSAPELLMLESQ